MIPAVLQKALKHLHLNYMRIEKTRLLAHKSLYWIYLNADIEETDKNCTTCPDFQAT